ncbi:hypothetical protein SAMN05421809_3566 [Natronorubrum daqingense]|uniref:Uncharacterized protein n=1 Tax=Natronorubrum daqingense TaxID=588898 RepID=A0A1N7FYC3_9EURY|nr:hypothetical protein BB347_17795 [Natronorubrum daqingense]SIS05284.1 hypothetical protein SAMN05421809_3566 [Natronorubrum daqingense]
MQNDRSRGNEYCPIDDGTAGRSIGHENTTNKTHPRQSPDTRAKGRTPHTRPSVEFPAKAPKRQDTTQYDELIVANDDAILFEASRGDH